MTGAETVERSKQLYERYLTPKLREVLGTMDQQEQDYFWAYLYLTAPTEVSRVVVDGIRADVESRVRPLPEEMRSGKRKNKNHL